VPSPDADPLSPIVITGGTGSYGTALARYLLAHTPARVRIYSRGEHRQNEMAAAFDHNPRLTFIIGDVRDARKLRQAADGCRAIVHAAALKAVGNGEANADEFAATNIDGTRNVIDAALEARVPRTLLISSDKSVQSVNLYGATKAVAEKLITQANKLGLTRGCAFAAIRGGNIWLSQGSVGVLWREAVRAGRPVVVNGPDTTRFHLCMDDWIALGEQVLRAMHGGEIFIPKAPAWRLGDLAEAFAPGAWVPAAPRPGDKPHETLIPPDEAPRTVDAGAVFVVQPHVALRDVWNYQPWDGAPVPADWRYSSDTVARLSLDELKELTR
jgi:UDP-N-acetylglucosamine 4,6-dehydratase